MRDEDEHARDEARWECRESPQKVSRLAFARVPGCLSESLRRVMKRTRTRCGLAPSRPLLPLLGPRVARTGLRRARWDCQTALALLRVSRAAAMAHSHASPADADDGRWFTAADAHSVYELAREDSKLGTKVAEALAIVERALDEYGCVPFRFPRPRQLVLGDTHTRLWTS